MSWLYIVHLCNFFSYLCSCDSHAPRRGSALPQHQPSAKVVLPMSEEDLQKLARKQEETLDVTKKSNSRISKFRELEPKPQEKVKPDEHMMDICIHHLTMISRFPEIMYLKNGTLVQYQSSHYICNVLFPRQRKLKSPQHCRSLRTTSLSALLRLLLRSVR